MVVNELRNINTEFLDQCTNSDLDKIKYYVEVKKFEPNLEQNYPIGKACENGHIEVVRYFLSFNQVNPSDFNNYAISQASGNGYIEVVKLLLKDKRLDLTDYIECVEFAYDNKHKDITLLLFNVDILRNNLKLYNIELYNKLKILFRKDKILNLLQNS